jgi:hypothetical protein
MNEDARDYVNPNYFEPSATSVTVRPPTYETEEEIRGLQNSILRREDHERRAKESGLREKYLVKENANKKIEKEMINR